MPVTTTRTMNPLPFNDLEPKRFEDLVRQLAYDFRPWRRLEATGRSGSDDGFDARALEIADLSESEGEPEGTEEAEEETRVVGAGDRLWLIQCKRERTITPAKMRAHLAEIGLSPEEKLHGIIFAAACDFSKTTRDTFLSWCRDQGIQEAFLWGKGELEDMLFQPKNDNLLFAYFGISLVIRRRSQATQIRAEIATKRKLDKTVLRSSMGVLLRDPSATEYPFAPKESGPEKWAVLRPERLSYDGLHMTVAWFFGYLNQKTGEWDAADAIRGMEEINHPWYVRDEKKEEAGRRAREIWNKLPDENRAWLKVWGVLPLRNIIAIDDIGDDVFDGTHIYVPFNGRDPFEGYVLRIEWQHGGIGFDPERERRLEIFPAELKRKP